MIKILTVEELLEGAKVDMPPLKSVNVTFKRAPKAKRKTGESSGSLFE